MLTVSCYTAAEAERNRKNDTALTHDARKQELPRARAAQQVAPHVTWGGSPGMAGCGVKSHSRSLARGGGAGTLPPAARMQLKYVIYRYGGYASELGLRLVFALSMDA